MRYKKGDLVIVRDWDDMCNEYSHSSSCIDTPIYIFISDMKKYCNKLYKIQDYETDCYHLNTISNYVFTDEMLVLAKES